MSLHLLSDHVDVPSILERFIELDDVGMVHLLQNFDLPREFGRVLDLLLRDFLYGAPAGLSRSLETSLEDGPESAGAEWLSFIKCTVLLLIS